MAKRFINVEMEQVGWFMTFVGQESYMELALAEAEAAGRRGEVPVGAVVVNSDGKVVARDQTESRGGLDFRPRDSV